MCIRDRVSSIGTGSLEKARGGIHLESDGLRLEGEIDLICARGGTFVICEVKTRSSLAYGHPAEAVTPAKQRRLRTLARRWIAERGGPVGLESLRFAAAAALGVLPVLVATAALPEPSAVRCGSAFIKSIQDADGSYGTSDLGQNVDAVFAVRAAGYDPAKDLVGGNGPVQFLTAKVAGVASPAAAAKAALGARALGMNPKAIAGIDLIARVNQDYDPAKGTYGGDNFSQSVAMLGLACTGNTVPPAAVAALKSTQLAPGGGWGFGGFTDPDTTCLLYTSPSPRDRTRTRMPSSA